MKGIFFILIISLFFGRDLLAQEKGGPEKIGIVDLQRAINAVEDGIKAKKILQAIMVKKQKDLDVEKEALVKLQEELKTKATLYKKEVKEAKFKEYQQKYYSLYSQYNKNREELQKLEIKHMGVILKRMEKIIEEIGKPGSYLLILEKSQSNILFFPQHFDLTNEVIRKYNDLKGN